MAFPQTTKTEKPIETNLTFLQKPLDVVYRDPIALKNINSEGKRQTLKALNALKIISPLVSAVMINPGIDEKNNNINHTFKSLVIEISEASKKFLQSLDIDHEDEKNLWIRNVVEKHLSYIAKDQWIKYGKISFNNFHELVAILETTDLSEQEPEYKDLLPDISVKLTLIKSLTLIQQEYQKASLFRNFHNDSQHISQLLFNAAKKQLPKLIAPEASTQDRAKIFCFLIDEASKVFVSAWQAEVKRVTFILNSSPKEKLDKYVEKAKSDGGFPINKILLEFDKFFIHIVDLTHNLVDSKEMGLANRI